MTPDLLSTKIVLGHFAVNFLLSVPLIFLGGIYKKRKMCISQSKIHFKNFTVMAIFFLYFFNEKCTGGGLEKINKIKLKIFRQL